ncbi:MAG: hypothetical protein REI64_00025 [Pedobacter sp.]|uniref:hypothetical protein n=1 Tax=Pedobacter sp. TaxID=1411316 RepID=UPI002808B5A9|nr:hypothetical protein [Pedobacter sp.]MDQ8003146.1 hypothetical protein [Pedobacter sp.]
MNENQKGALAAKKHQIQLRIRVDDFIDRHLLNWLEIYETILSCNIDYELVQLANVAEEEIIFWEKALAKAPFNTYNFDTKNLNTDEEKSISGILYDIYPSTYPLRFMPSDILPYLISDKAEEIITDFAQQLGLSLNQEVYLMYLYYTPIVKLKLKDIIAYAPQLYDFPMEDILIAATSFDWIIFRSMEDEWRFCRRTTKLS